MNVALLLLLYADCKGKNQFLSDSTLFELLDNSSLTSCVPDNQTTLFTKMISLRLFIFIYSYDLLLLDLVTLLPSSSLFLPE